MVWALVNSSDATVALTGHPRSAFQAATEALQAGDLQPARRLMSDDVLRHVLVWGSRVEIGTRWRNWSDRCGRSVSACRCCKRMYPKRSTRVRPLLARCAVS